MSLLNAINELRRVRKIAAAQYAELSTKPVVVLKPRIDLPSNTVVKLDKEQ